MEGPVAKLFIEECSPDSLRAIHDRLVMEIKYATEELWDASLACKDAKKALDDAEEMETYRRCVVDKLSLALDTINKEIKGRDEQHKHAK